MLLSLAAVVASPYALTNGEVWLDTDGNQIEAHGGAILKIGNVPFWLILTIMLYRMNQRPLSDT